MSTSNRKSSSSGSRPRATKRQGLGATPRGSRPASQGLGSRGGLRGSAARPSARPRGSLRPEAHSLRSSGSLRAPAAPSRREASRRATPGRPAAGRPLMGAPRGGGSGSRSGQGSARLEARRAEMRTARLEAGSSASRITLAFRAAVAVGVVALVAVVALLVMSHLPVFTITGIDAQASEHVSSDSIAKLAAVEEGTTLLSVDVPQIQANVKRNPWVKKVNVTREFPDTLGISVEERGIWAVVLIGSGASVWALGDDGTWIEPVQVTPDESGDLSAAALAKARELGCLLISQVPSTVDPSQGSAATDDVIQAVLTYQRTFSEDLASQVQTYYASSTGSISMVLKSGLEVSLGTPSDVSSKQAALTQIMSTYPDQLTYVNVRVPTKPTYRKVSGSSYGAGTDSTGGSGASGHGGSTS